MVSEFFGMKYVGGFREKKRVVGNRNMLCLLFIMCLTPHKACSRHHLFSSDESHGTGTATLNCVPHKDMSKSYPPPCTCECDPIWK